MSRKPVSNRKQKHTEKKRPGTRLTARAPHEGDVLQAIMENTNAELAYLDPGFVFVRVNSAYAKASGHTPQELIGRKHFDLFPNAENQAIFERVRDSGEPVAFFAKPFEFANQPGRGVTFWNWTLVPIKNDRGRVQGLVLSLLDVTETIHSEQAIEAQARRIEAIIGGITDAYMAVDRDMRFTEINAVAEKNILGRPRAELIGKQFGEVFPEYRETDFMPHIYRARDENQPVHFEARSAINSRWYEGHIYPGDSGLDIYLRDITARKDAEQQLRASEQQNRAIVDTVLDGLIIIDQSGLIHSFNPAAERIFGYRAEQVVGQSVNRLMPEPYRSTHDRYIQTDLTTGIAHIIGIGRETIGVRADGSIVPIELMVSEFQAQGVRYFTGTVHDITERKRAEQALRASEARYRELFEQMLDGFALHEIICDEQGRPVDYRFLDANPAFERLTGLKAAEIRGRTVLEVLPGVESVWIERYGQVALTGEPAHFADYSADLGRSFEVTAFSPQPGQFAAIFVDVTERLVAERERDELFSREQASRRQAEEALKLRERFLTMASHELRTPLTSISGYAQILEQRAATSQDWEPLDRRAIQTIRSQTDRLERMITELLDVGRLEEGRLTIDRKMLDLTALVERVVAGFEPTLGRHELQVTMAERPVFVLADEMRLEQVVRNLVDNALKYTPGGGKIEVEVAVVCDRAVVTVRDHGIGIPTEDLPRLFEQFYRAGNAQGSNVPGLGVGLYLSREIVRRHGGDITVESREKEGSTFRIDLPRARP